MLLNSQSIITYILSNLWEDNFFERFRGKTSNTMHTINKIKAQIVSVRKNSKATTSSSSLDVFRIIKAFNIHFRPPRTPKTIEILCHPPPLNWMKCNCDGAYYHDSLPVSCGGGFETTLEIFACFFC